jgi:hypothetical protein
MSQHGNGIERGSYRTRYSGGGDEAAKATYAFPVNEAVVEAIRHTSDLSKAETPVYDTMANMPEGFSAQYNVVAQNKRHEFSNDEVANQCHSGQRGRQPDQL